MVENSSLTWIQKYAKLSPNLPNLLFTYHSPHLTLPFVPPPPPPDLEAAITPLLSAPGEIRREFEQQLEAVRDEEQERRSRSERASRELIDRLEQDQAEESRRRQEQERRDEELARGVMQEEERVRRGEKKGVVV